MDNQELAERLKAIAAELEGCVEGLRHQPSSQVRRLTDAEHDALMALLAAQRAPPEPRELAGWPTPATTTQGFLNARWQRRDGDSYAGAAARGLPGPNSPIRGGDDAGAEVDVPSGEPRNAIGN